MFLKNFFLCIIAFLSMNLFSNTYFVCVTDSVYDATPDYIKNVSFKDWALSNEFVFQKVVLMRPFRTRPVNLTQVTFHPCTYLIHYLSDEHQSRLWLSQEIKMIMESRTKYKLPKYVVFIVGREFRERPAKLLEGLNVKNVSIFYESKTRMEDILASIQNHLVHKKKKN